MNPILQRRLEATFILAASILVYYASAYDMGRFAIRFFLPDIAVFAYLAGPKIGAYCYNLTHFFVLPIIVLGMAHYQQSELLQQVALIWAAHIAFDRTLGWGLKYKTSFMNTDMGEKDLPNAPAFLK